MPPFRVSIQIVLILLFGVTASGGYSCEVTHLRFQNNSRFTIKNNVLKGTEISYHNDCIGYSVGKFVFDSLGNNLDLVGLIDAVTGEEYTYRKMRERSVRCALWMRSQGLLPRDVVAICSNNRLDYTMPCFAALYLGAIFSAWDVTMDAESFRHRINISKPKMVFANEGSVAVVAEAVRRAKVDIKIIVFERSPGFLEFDSIIGEPGSDEVERFACIPIESLGEIALILFSSGTTGPSKGVALSHGTLKNQIHQSEAFGMVGNVCLNFAATDWITAIHTAFMNIFTNTPRFILPYFQDYSACALIEKHKASWIFLSPTMINRLLKYGAASEYDLSSVTRVIHTGAMLSIASYTAFSKLLPNAAIFSGYGLTEFGSYLSLQSIKSKPGSCGQIMANAQLKVIDPNTGRTLGANQRGELLLKNPFMMSFYHDNPEATAQAFDEEGWLRTGDLGYYDEDGEIFVIDRLKDIIRCVDYDICPSEVESVILSHPGVKEAAVVGQPRDDEQDLLLAFVVRVKDDFYNGEEVSETEIVDLVAAELPESRRLRAGVKFVDHIPKTASSKIQRILLRGLARSMVRV